MPEHNALLTGCFYCDDMTHEAGPTKVVPGTHKLRRHPTPDEVTAEVGAEPLLAPKYSIGLWIDTLLRFSDWVDEPSFRAYEQSPEHLTHRARLHPYRVSGSMTTMHVLAGLPGAAGAARPGAGP